MSNPWSDSVCVVAYCICEECSSGQSEGVATSKAEAIKLAKAGGWRVVKGLVLCPECQKQVTP